MEGSVQRRCLEDVRLEQPGSSILGGDMVLLSVRLLRDGSYIRRCIRGANNDTMIL